MQQVLRNMEYFKDYIAYQQRREQREQHRRRRLQRMTRSLPEASGLTQATECAAEGPDRDTGSESEPEGARRPRKTRAAAHMRRRLSHEICHYQKRVGAPCVSFERLPPSSWRCLFSSLLWVQLSFFPNR